MIRTSTQIQIVVNNISTWLPWIGNAPDFSVYQDPTLSILKKAWEDNEDGIQVVPDPTIIENLEPNWQGFGGSVLQSAFYEKYKSNPDFQTLISFVATFAGSGDNPALYPAFGMVWNKFAESAELLSEEIIEIDQFGNYFNMPFNIVDGGQMVFNLEY